MSGKYLRHNFLHFTAMVLIYTVKSVISITIWGVILTIGYIIFINKKSPFDLIIGIPMIFAGIGLIINSLITLLMSLFSFKYNKGMCYWCEKRKVGK